MTSCAGSRVWSILLVCLIGAYGLLAGRAYAQSSSSDLLAPEVVNAAEGFAIRPPAGWQATTPPAPQVKACFVGPSKGPGAPMLAVWVDVAPGNVEEFVVQLRHYYQRTRPENEVLHLDIPFRNNQPLRAFVEWAYTAQTAPTGASLRLRSIQHILGVGERKFTAECTAPADEFESYRPLFDAVLSTFRLTSPPPEGQIIVLRQYLPLGTAFVVSADGYLLTVGHVVKNADKLKLGVVLGDKSHEARVVARDDVYDLALLRIDAQELSPLPLGDSDAVLPGEDALAFGFPLSDKLGESLKVTRGTISGIEKSQGVKYFQTDLVVNPGNSGGPVINEKGEVIGIVAGKVTSTFTISSIGLVKPINLARKLLEENRVNVHKGGAADRLDGPMLFKRVSPSVALVTGSAMPGIASTPAAQGAEYKIAPDGRYVNTRYNFSIMPPAGWRMDTSGKQGIVVFISPAQAGGPSPGIISVVHRISACSLFDYVDRFKKTAEATLAGYKMLRDVRLEITGREAYEITFNFNQVINKLIFVWRNVKTIIGGPGDAKYEITCGALDAHFPQYEQTFTTTARSFRVEE